MWSQQISKRPLVFTLALVAGLLALSAEASLIPKTHHSDLVNLLPRDVMYSRPGRSCTPGDTVNPCLTTCNPVETCDYFNECNNYCTLIPLGGSGCNPDSVFQECAKGGCIDGTCAMVPTGGKCYLNRNCASGLCSEDGICINPKPQAQLINQICSTDTQCLSNSCIKAKPGNEVCRDDSGDCEDVLRCGPYKINQRCASDAECAQGACSASGTCEYLPNYTPCTEDEQCSSQFCDGPDAITKTCGLVAGNGTCSFNKSCVSKACVNSACKLSNDGQTCREDRDCVWGNCDEGNGTCLASAGTSCTNNAMCASELCENGKCSKISTGGFCISSTQCMSGSCKVWNFDCGPYGCYTPSYCTESPNGRPCMYHSDCSIKSSCVGSVAGSKSGTCIAGTAGTTIRTATSTSRSSTTSVKTTSVRTSTKPATTASTGKATTTSKATTTTTKAITTTTTTKATSTTALPSAAACTANAVCKSSYCRKTLLSDGVTRASTGKCDVKKATGARCYQNGGCLSGTCNKMRGVCL